jgi:uncharacterized lipoprotein YmbA
MGRLFAAGFAATLVAAALVTGCARGPATQYYRLASGEATGGELGARPELGLAIGPNQFPRYLDRPEIVTRDGAQRLALAERQRWAGSLRDDFSRALADDLGRRLGTSRVALYPSEPRFRVDYRVLVDVLGFEGVLGEAVTLRARWVVASGKDGRALLTEESRIEEPVASADYADLVSAHAAALGRLAGEIAGGIATLPGAR